MLIAIIIKRSDSRQEEGIESFWDRDRHSKLVPAKDLSSLPYLNVPIDKFYFGSIETDEVKAMEDEIIAISKKPLLNLTGKTNIELRETYGSPNLEAMKEIGEDFDKLTIVLVSYAESLINAGLLTEAITVLEYGVFIRSDVSKNYTLLADCFQKLGQKRRVEMLKEQVPKILMAPSIYNHIDSILTEMDGELVDIPLPENNPDT